MEQGEWNRVHSMGVLGALFCFHVHTKSIRYKRNYCPSSHGLHELASLLWVIFDCGGRLRNGVVVRIVHDILLITGRLTSLVLRYK